MAWQSTFSCYLFSFFLVADSISKNSHFRFQSVWLYAQRNQIIWPISTSVNCTICDSTHQKHFLRLLLRRAIHTFFLFHWFMDIRGSWNRRWIHRFRFLRWHLHHSFCDHIRSHGRMDKFWGWHTRRDKNFHYEGRTRKNIRWSFYLIILMYLTWKYFKQSICNNIERSCSNNPSPRKSTQFPKTGMLASIVRHKTSITPISFKIIFNFKLNKIEPNLWSLFWSPYLIL